VTSPLRSEHMKLRRRNYQVDDRLQTKPDRKKSHENCLAKLMEEKIAMS
jgi:hypothetical protein